ncbi:NAD-dependent epimerase/dehydratase family protein [Methylobacterium marchantiae]|uniref:NAD-dependent epimerase/dehydratase family protein n=1 Tax=Methylobacterium marchantiae TaxID=600331 RepID=A0ABW3X469_9HYPH|nr:CDP-abequose synthase [Methylobacterium marchantiae]
MRVAITGASGFLGSRVAAALSARGDDVVALLRPSSVAAPGGGSVLRYASADEAGRHVEALAPDVLIHMAAAQGRRGERAAAMVDANVTLGAALLQAMRPGTLFINTDTTLPPEVNLYALTKRQFADLARLLVTQEKSGAHVANAQLQMMYGPGDDPAKFVPSLALQLVENAAPLVTTPATQRRDFIHVDDAIAAVLTLVDARTRLAPWQDVPIGAGRAVPLGDFIARAIAISGFDRPWQKSLPPRPGEPAEMVADTSILRGLGWTPRVTLDDGIAQLIGDARTTAGGR